MGEKKIVKQSKRLVDLMAHAAKIPQIKDSKKVEIHKIFTEILGQGPMVKKG